MALSPGQTMWIEGWDIARNEPSPRQVEIVARGSLIQVIRDRERA